MNHRPSVEELAKFRKLPAAERRALASTILGGLQDIHRSAIKVRHEFIELNSLVSYVAIKQGIEDGIVFWRREMQRAAWDTKHKKSTTGAGRSPAIKAQGCAALASLAGSFAEALNRSGNAKVVTA